MVKQSDSLLKNNFLSLLVEIFFYKYHARGAKPHKRSFRCARATDFNFVKIKFLKNRGTKIMTIKDLKNIIKVNVKDEIIYIKNDERIQPEEDDTVVEIQGSGDWDGFVTYVVTVA